MAKLKYTFIALEEDIRNFLNPIPASKAIPEWYKKLPKYRDAYTSEPSESSFKIINDSFVPQFTMKQCIPVRDYLTAGYIIPLWAEIGVSFDQSGPKFIGSDPSIIKIEPHHLNQIKDTPLQKEQNVKGSLHKLISPWAFKTPPGYSTLFFSPRFYKGKIEILPSIVDTDTHHSVNFPFIYRGAANKDCILEIGQPIVQLVPFKRESWYHTFENASVHDTDKKFMTYLMDAYRKQRHKKKSYT